MRQAGFCDRAAELGGYDVGDAGAVRLVSQGEDELSARYN